MSSRGGRLADAAGGTLERSSIPLLLLGAEMNEPEMMRNRFLSVAQFHERPANKKDGKHTSRLSPFTAALISHDLNCKCVCGPGEASSNAAPDTCASSPLDDRNDALQNSKVN